MGFLGDSHDFGDRCVGAQTWRVTLPGLISWGSMTLNPGGFILMGASALSPGARLLAHLGHVLTVTSDTRRKGMVDVNSGSLHFHHHGSPERNYPAQRLSAQETRHQGGLLTISARPPFQVLQTAPRISWTFTGTTVDN